MLNRSLGLALLSGLMAAGSALSQTRENVIGSAAEVQGLVTISDRTTVASVVNRSPLVEGSRVVTSSTGSVTLKLDDGCDVKLKPNQSFIIRRSNCEALIASIETLSSENIAALIGGGVTGGVGVRIIAAGLGMGALAIGDFAKGDPGGAGGAGGAIPNLPISGQ